MSPARGTHRTALIDAMRQLSLSQGFPATTVDQVCERAGVTKGSFYHHFSGKDDLGLAALQAYFDDLAGALSTGSWTKSVEPVERLRAFLAHAADVTSGPLMSHGCLMGSFSLDLAEGSPDMRQRLSMMFAALEDVVAGLIREAASAAGRDVDASKLAEQFLAIVEGSIVLAKANADRATPRRGLEMFGEYLDLLLGDHAPASKPRRRTRA